MQDETFRSMIHGLERLGVSRNQIAQNCAVSRQTVWRLAEGRILIPTLPTARRIEDFYRHVSPVKQKRV
jgi:transcriptional regulator with XRE-family HTH domain